MRKKAERVMRKPYKTPESSEMRLKPLIKKGLHKSKQSVIWKQEPELGLSGNHLNISYALREMKRDHKGQNE